MKIAVINNIYVQAVCSGSVMVTKKIVTGLEKSGHEVFIVACGREEKKVGQIFYLKSIFPILEKYPLTIRFFWHLWDFFNFGHSRSLKKILSKEEPDLVITNNLQGLGFFIPRLLKKLKIRHFHILHDIQLLHPSGLMFYKKEKILRTNHAKVYQALMRFVFGSPEIIISPSKWLLAEHKKRLFFKNSKKIVLPNYFLASGVNSQKLNPECLGKNSKFTFLYVGQIEPHKGVKFLVKAFAKFLEKNSTAELLIVGLGSQEEKLKKIASVNPAIKFLGLKKPEERDVLMRQADCFIVPSLCYENSPTVIYEAITAQLPVIASQIGGIPELIEAAGGWLFEPENEKELLEKIFLAISAPIELEKIKNQEKNWQPADFIEVLSGFIQSGGKS